MTPTAVDALRGLLQVIEEGYLIPESYSSMRQAREVLARMEATRSENGNPVEVQGSPDVSRVARGYREVLEGLFGPGWEENPHTRDTPERAARAMVNELCLGLHTLPPKMTTFPLEGASNMIISQKIPVKSLCAHHLLPFIGEAVVAYIPKDRVLGLSKLSRAVDYCARKPQVQESLTSDIADFLCKTLGFNTDAHEPLMEMDEWGVGVVIRARHTCMELRGVSHGSDVTTSALRGVFLQSEVRSEFLGLSTQ